MSTSTEAMRTSDWLVWLASRELSLEVRTLDDEVAATVGYPTGEVMKVGTGTNLTGMVTAGVAAPVAILMEPVALADLVAGETKRLCLVGAGKGIAATYASGGAYGGSAVVTRDGLKFATAVAEGTISDANRTTCLTALQALGIAIVETPAATTQTT